MLEIKNKSVPDLNNICQNCDISCVAGRCSVGTDSTKCLECSASTKYLDALTTCVLPNLCGTGYKGIFLI